jgi:hypothetical protein
MVCNDSVQTGSFANLTHLNLSKNGLAMIFTLDVGGLVAAFADHVHNVLLVGAFKQMVRVHTRRVVARVASLESEQEWAVQFAHQNQPMGVLGGAVQRELSISFQGLTPLPDPTPITVVGGYFDLVPKAWGESLVSSLVHLGKCKHRCVPRQYPAGIPNS